ncbi:MAG TPA: response regulator [Candidatus Sulfotelmatobacter sp.]|nr:response regulator [Candidatus Sulfotelmatobacter sp.]
MMAKDIHNKSVLIVDDDERMLRALDKVLTNEGATVMCSSWAGSAIGLLTEKRMPVDLVIVDLSMPFISGLTTMHAIHNHYPNLPIIVLTAYGSPVVKAECLREGAAAFLEKPLNSSVLIDAIKGVFELHENRTTGSGPMTRGAGETHMEQGKRD